MDWLSYWRTPGQPKGLQTLILIGRVFDATNPWDLIFGLLGIALDVEDGMLLPDYEQLTEEIFTRWTRFLMTRNRRATLLHAAGLRETGVLKNIPSWVLDLTVRVEDGNTNTTIFREVAEVIGFRAAETSKLIL